ncbi:MAG: hypothetical protein ACRDDW_03275 [Candidatus Rhabdochlamydia sp.]
MPKNNDTNNLFLNQKIVQTAINYTALADDVIIEVTNTSAPRTITLPAASANNRGKFYIIKDISGGALSKNISVVPASGTIDGSLSLLIGTNYGAIQAYSDGASYYSQSLVLPSRTGNPLGSASWRKISGSGFVPTGGEPTQTLPNITSPMATSGLVDFSTLTADHITNITASTSSFTIVRAGMYLLSFDAGIVTNSNNATGCIAQMVKNSTTVIIGALDAMTNNFASYLGGRVLTNLVAGDVIDVRFGTYNGFGYLFYSLEIFAQQFPLTF